ncbi:nucleolar protein 12-domain-containing protein [Russula dissimulans]|nr:nucleolar protein 12-domain-containing protein [Russula dissimulans]
MASNVALLTQSHKVIKAKKRQKLGQVNAVVFDEDARREFLTGFHKRKLAKKEESKKKAQAREKEERLEARREQRRMLAEQAAQNAAKVEEAYRGFVQPIIESDEEWTGISRAGLSSEEREAERHEREYEYSDEERLATVTVVEDFDPSLHPPGTPAPASSSSLSEEHGAGDPPPPRGGEGRWEGRKRRVDEGSTAKKVTVRYETKAARRATRATQRARRTEKAERAGGKAARKNKNKKAGGKKSRG